jgi:hypothetical protein
MRWQATHCSVSCRMCLGGHGSGQKQAWAMGQYESRAANYQPSVRCLSQACACASASVGGAVDGESPSIPAADSDTIGGRRGETKQ